MQQARLYLLKHFDELQSEAVKVAENARDAAKSDYERERALFWAFNQAAVERYGEDAAYELRRKALDAVRSR
jgi:hypothetical protein